MNNFYKDDVLPFIDEFYTEDEFSNDYSGYYSGDIEDIPMTEREYYLEYTTDIEAYIENIEYQNPDIYKLDEASYQERVNDVFKLAVLDTNLFIKRNPSTKEIKNPTFFSSNGVPTADGLLSNEIFGITQKSRSGIYGYIDLVEYFLDPSCYKILLKLDRKFASVIKGLGSWKIDEKGKLINDPEGDGSNTGIRWLKDNFDKLDFMSTGSMVRDLRISYIKLNYKKGVLFLNKYIVIPAYYRDVNTSGKYTGVGQINTLYTNLIVSARALRENNNYGLSMADTTCARVQDTLVMIYDWFCGNNNPSLVDRGTGISGKFGLIRRANMSYTSDYSSRLVLSAPELKVETVNDLMVNLDRSAAPLAACVADFYPFVLFHLRKFFENEFLNVVSYDVLSPGSDTEEAHFTTVRVKNPMIAFSDDILKTRLKEFLRGYDNRFIPIRVPTENPNDIYFMAFKGERWIDMKDAIQGKERIVRRALTWTDVIYIAAKKATEGKKISFTRFPYDSYFNTIYTGVEVASTKETEPMYVNGEYYQFYPKIEQSDILESTANKFVDTMQVCNLYLKGMGADYDGDTGVMKGSFFKETNEELANFVDSKANFINLGCENIRVSSNEAVQSLYNLTKVLNGDENKLSNPVF